MLQAHPPGQLGQPGLGLGQRHRRCGDRHSLKYRSSWSDS
jgi:hypothetical protein